MAEVEAFAEPANETFHARPRAHALLALDDDPIRLLRHAAGKRLVDGAAAIKTSIARLSLAERRKARLSELERRRLSEFYAAAIRARTGKEAS